MLIEHTLFGTVDKVADAIQMLKDFEPKEWHKETWNLMYPWHPYSPGLWTWGYPVRRKR